MPRLPHLRTALLVLLCSLLAFAALTPAHGNGPCFCLCPWEEVLGEGEGERGSGDGSLQCEDEVPLRTCEVPAFLLPPQESATIAVRTRREGSPSELRWNRCRLACASDPGGTPSRLAGALALRI